MIYIHSGQKFMWDAVAGAEVYDFDILDASGVTVLAAFHDLIVLEKAVEEACAGLVAGTTYNARVRANDSFGNGAWSPNLTFQIVTLPAPANLRVV